MPRNKPEKGKAIPSAAGSYVSSDPGKLRYGRFLEAADLLCKYIKPKDNILVTGSGNSDLGAEMYFAGLKNITIIDDSQVLVDRMAKRYKSDCPDMKFVKDDLMQMGTVDDQSFTVVLDKATFDAVVADGSAKSSEIARKTCLEVDRVLKWSGRYICISLAQKHALTPLVMNMAERNYAVRGHVLNIVNEHFGSLPDAVFCFVFTKMKAGGPLVCDLQLHPTEKIIRLHDLHQFFRQIREYQYAQTLRGCLKMGRYDDVEGEHLKIFSGDKSAHQYNLYPYKSDVKRPQFAAACFIIPPGRSKTYLYGTHEGRKEVAEKSIRAQLVMFVEVVRSFGGVFNFDIVKEELTPHLKNLTPSKLFENMVFITDGAFPESEKFVPGDDVIFEGESPTTGGYRVIQRRLPGENDYERRLIFTANPSVIQTEMRIKKVDDSRGPGSDEGGTECNKDYLPSDYQRCIIAAMINHKTLLSEKCTEPKILLIGLGGGVLTSFMHHNFPSAAITAVEIDPAMIQIAIDFFGLTVDDRCAVHVGDGLEFLKEALERQEYYDIIVVDADTKDSQLPLRCPPMNFVSQEMLQTMHSLLRAGGMLAVNILSRQAAITETVKNCMLDVFGNLIYTIGLDEELNCVAVALHESYYLPSLDEKAEGRRPKISEHALDSWKESLRKFNRLMDEKCGEILLDESSWWKRSEILFTVPFLQKADICSPDV